MCPRCHQEAGAWRGFPASRVKFCETCILGFTDPRPTHNDLLRAYGPTYRPVGPRFVPMVERVLDVMYRRLARFIDRKTSAGPILDYGAGDGRLVYALRRRGRQADGIDEWSPAPGVAKVELSSIISSSYSAVVLWHVLEHLTDVDQALTEIRRILIPNGVLIVAVHIMSLQARLFGNAWYGLDPDRHLLHFSPQSLQILLRQHRFYISEWLNGSGRQNFIGWLDGIIGLFMRDISLLDALRVPRSEHERNVTLGRLGLALMALTPIAVLGTATEQVIRMPGTICVIAIRE